MRHYSRTILVQTILLCLFLSLSWSAFPETPKQPIYINFFNHTVDGINTELAHPAIRRLLQMFMDVGIKADFYFQGSVIASIDKAPKDPDLLPTLRKATAAGFGLGTINDEALPRLDDAVKNLDWEAAYEVTGNYCTKYQDVISGELDLNREGHTALLHRLTGKYVDVCLRHHTAQETYYHRERGAIATIGGYPHDAVADVVPPPLGMYMGMMAIIPYPLPATPSKDNMPGPNSFSGTKEEIERGMDAMFASVPRDRVQFLYMGGHNVDMYANNEKWNATGKGHPRHVEARAFGEKNPSSLDEARIPQEFLFDKETSEQRYKTREIYLRHIKEIAESDPSVHVVAIRELLDHVRCEKTRQVSSETVKQIAEFILSKTDKGPPEYVNLEGEPPLSLAEAFQALAGFLAAYQKSGAPPTTVSVDKDVIGPVELPDSWTEKAGNLASLQSKSVSVAEIARAASNAMAYTAASKRQALPSQVALADSRLVLDLGELLYACAGAAKVMAAGKADAKVSLKEVSVFPEGKLGSKTPWLSDAEAAKNDRITQFRNFQTWTVKPATFK